MTKSKKIMFAVFLPIMAIVVLCLGMTFGTPRTASAAETTVEVATYDELVAANTNASDAAADHTTIKLTDNITLTANLVISKNITLDLGTKTVTLADGVGIDFNNSTAEFNVKNGNITYAGTTVSVRPINIISASKASIQDITLDSTSGFGIHDGAGITEITGCTITVNPGENAVYGVYVDGVNNVSTTIDHCTIQIRGLQKSHVVVPTKPSNPTAAEKEEYNQKVQEYNQKVHEEQINYPANAIFVAKSCSDTSFAIRDSIITAIVDDEYKHMGIYSNAFANAAVSDGDYIIERSTFSGAKYGIVDQCKVNTIINSCTFSCTSMAILNQSQGNLIVSGENNFSGYGGKNLADGIYDSSSGYMAILGKLIYGENCSTGIHTRKPENSATYHDTGASIYINATITGTLGVYALTDYSKSKLLIENSKIGLTDDSGNRIDNIGWGISGNGTPKYGGTVIEIRNTDIATVGDCIYHPQDGKLIIDGGSLKCDASCIEIRAGSVIIKNGAKITTTASNFNVHANTSGGTVDGGAAVVVSPHTTNIPINVVIENAILSAGGGAGKAFVEVETRDKLLPGTPTSNLPDKDPAPIDITIYDGSFEGEIYVAECNDKDTNPKDKVYDWQLTHYTGAEEIAAHLSHMKLHFIHGGEYDQLPNAAYVAENTVNYHESDGKYLILSDVEQAKRDARLYLMLYAATRKVEYTEAINNIIFTYDHVNIADVDAAKYQAVLKIDEIYYALVEFKNNAIAEIKDAAEGKPATDTTEAVEAVAVPTSTYSTIYDALSEEEVTAFKESTLAEIDKVRELNKYKKDAIKEIDDYAAGNAVTDTKEGVEKVNVPAAIYAAVNGATSKAEVDAFKANAIKEIDKMREKNASDKELGDKVDDLGNQVTEIDGKVDGLGGTSAGTEAPGTEEKGEEDMTGVYAMLILATILIVAVLVLVVVLLVKKSDKDKDEKKEEPVAEEPVAAAEETATTEEPKPEEPKPEEPASAAEEPAVAEEPATEEVAAASAASAAVAEEPEAEEEPVAEDDVDEEEVDEDDDDEDDEDDDVDDDVDVDVTGGGDGIDVDVAVAVKPKRKRRPSKPFEQRLREADDTILDDYSMIKNEFCAYTGVKSRICKSCETFRLGRKLFAKVKIIGKSLRIYLALDPNAYDEKKYHHVDKSEVKAYMQVPMMVKVNGPRTIKRASDLIADCLKETKRDDEYMWVDYNEQVKQQRAELAAAQAVQNAATTNSDDNNA